MPKIDDYILIVEDSPDLRHLLQSLYAGEGYSLKMTNNGKEAIDFLRSTKALPFFILLDLMMPIMNGLEFRAEQRQDCRLVEIPIVVMSADSEIEAKAREIEAQAFLKKPFKNVDDLLEAAIKFRPINQKNLIRTAPAQMK